MWSALSHGEAFPGAQRTASGLAGAVLTVVDERAHRGEPEAALVGRLGALLLRVRAHQRGVDVDDHLTASRCLPVPASGRRRAHTAARASARA